MSAVDLPAELVAYIVWIIGEIEEANCRFQALLEQILVNASTTAAVHPDTTRWRDDWGS